MRARGRALDYRVSQRVSGYASKAGCGQNCPPRGGSRFAATKMVLEFGAAQSVPTEILSLGGPPLRAGLTSHQSERKKCRIAS